MNKICGYSCEHNKGGVCQITSCDKKIMMTTTTEPQVLTRWQDPTIQDLKDTLKDREEYCDKLEEDRENILIENKKQKEVLDKIKEYCETERVNILTNFEYLETTDLDNILKLLEEINGRNI